MMGRAGLLDLERHFAMYGAYHNHPVNALIHDILVWPLVFNGLLLLHFTPPLFHLSLPFALLPNFGFAFTVIYALFYVSLDRKAGSLAALLCILCWLGSSYLGSRLPFSLAWKVVLAAQSVCWTAQFIGHGVFEKRAPALVGNLSQGFMGDLFPALYDNLSEAFLLAPFFVLLEVLQKALDYEPYPGFQASVRAKIEADINDWHASKQKKSS